MIIEIPKSMSEEKVRALLNLKKNTQNDDTINKFFGKLPHLKDGMKMQKKIRNK